MSKHVTFYTSEEQKEMVERMADRQGMSLSQYCVEAMDRQLARDIRSERVSDTELEEQLNEMQDTVLGEVDSALSPTTDEEVLYGTALWNLISGEYEREEQAAALSQASDRLDEGVEKLHEKEDDA